MAEMRATGGRVAFAPLGSSEWTEIPTESISWIGTPIEPEQELYDLRRALAGASMSFEFTMKRRDLRRMIRRLRIRRTAAGIRRSAMHAEYHRRRNRR